MRICILGLGCLTAAIMALPISASAASILVDGGFESGTTNFSTSFDEQAGARGAGSYDITGQQANLTPNSGNFFMAINGFDTTVLQRIWGQSVDVVAGTTYDLSGFVGTWSNGLPLGSFDVVIGGQLILSVTAPSQNNVWEAFGTSWTATSTGSLDLDFVETANSFGATDYALDDLAFTARPVAPIPLPASLPLLVLGLGGLMWRGRGRS